jgi:hypothetical protein
LAVLRCARADLKKKPLCGLLVSSNDMHQSMKRAPGVFRMLQHRQKQSPLGFFSLLGGSSLKAMQNDAPGHSSDGTNYGAGYPD